MGRTGAAGAVLCLVLLAGCSGLFGASGAGVGGAQYGVAVESEYPSPERLGVRVKQSGFDGEVVFNRSRVLDPGERWHVANLSFGRYGNGSYTLQFTVDGEVVDSMSLVFASEDPDRGAVTKGALQVEGPDGSGTTVCEGSVTCYRSR